MTSDEEHDRLSETEAFGESARRRAEGQAESEVESMAMRQILLYFVMPLWLGPGLLDYWWHRKAKIEETSGTFESLTHAAMMTLAGVPVLMSLFLEINALVLTSMAAAWLAHEGVAYIDVLYAKSLREVPVGEQQTHSFLEVFPLSAMFFAAAMNWKQVLAIVGKGEEPPRWRFERKRPPLTKRYVAAILAGVGACVALPYGEELLRCYRRDGTFLPHRREQSS